MQETVSFSLNEKLSLASFFSGVGGIELGFEQTSEFSTVYANEFDKYAQQTYQLNFPEVYLDKRDIRDVESNDIPDVDIITGGFPCQAFSIAGYRLGFEDDRGDLFFELLRLIKHKKPPMIFIENVKNMVTHDHGNTFKVIREALVANGYSIAWKVLNGMTHGNVPQNRERIYIVGFLDKSKAQQFHFPDAIERTANLDSIIDFDGQMDESYYYRHGKQPFYDTLEAGVTSDQTVYQWRRQYVRENKSGVVPTLTANMGTGGHNVPIIRSKYGIRKMTPRETFNTQGYPKDFKLPEDIAKSHLYKQAGNSVVVPVIRRIAENIIDTYNLSSNNEVLFPNLNDKYAIISLDIDGRYSGNSSVLEYVTKYDDALNYVNNNETLDRYLISDEEYLQIVKRGSSGRYYMIISL